MAYLMSCWYPSCMPERETSSRTTHSPWKEPCRQTGSSRSLPLLGHPSLLHQESLKTVAAEHMWEAYWRRVTPVAVGQCSCEGETFLGCTLRRRRLETVAIPHSTHHQLERLRRSSLLFPERLEWIARRGWGWGNSSWRSAPPHWNTQLEQAVHWEWLVFLVGKSCCSMWCVG